jgi:hypothetical protein
LHESSNQELLAQFAHDRNHRALLISRVDQQSHKEDDDHKDETSGSPTKHVEGEQVDDGRDKGELGETEILQGGELRFSLKV